MKIYFGMESPPVDITAFAIGNGVLGSEAVYFAVPTVRCLIKLHNGRNTQERVAFHIGDLSATDRL